jgi:Flp pilus assembly pilin Flp
MARFAARFTVLVRGETGATAVELGVMVALISVLTLAAVALLGDRVNGF